LIKQGKIDAPFYVRANGRVVVKDYNLIKDLNGMKMPVELFKQLYTEYVRQFASDLTHQST